MQPFTAARRGAVSRMAALGRCEDGVAILEFALVLPMLLVLLGGAFELGRAVLIRERMIGAVRDAATYLARVPDPTCEETCALGAVRALARARDGIVDGAGVPRATVTVSSRTDPVAATVTVTANVRLSVELLRLGGLGPTMTLDVADSEQRLGR